MSQIRVPFTTPATQGRRPATPTYVWWVDVVIVLVIITAIYGLVQAAARWTASFTPVTQIDLAPQALPLYAALSTLRMALAYALSLIFSLIYARIAVTSRTAERVMLPLLDILQSIPILSFLPVVVLALVALFPHSNIGLELAAILLIFTSQAWNMTFSYHQSLLTIPKELQEASSIYRLNAWRRFTRLELPFGAIPLIWNSMMSWAGGWFFLIAAEQFTLNGRSFQLAGLGSYLQTAANAGDIGALLLGLGTLIVVIVLLDQFLWRPLIAWADRFKLEQTGSGVAPTSWVLRGLRRSALLDWADMHIFAPTNEALDRQLARLLSAVTPGPRATVSPKQAAKRGLSPRRMFAIVVWLAIGVLCVLGTIATVRLLAQVTAPDWGTIILGTGATLLRTTAALVIGVAWTVPLGVAIGLNPRLARTAQPLVQMVASVPATGLFPVLLLVLLGLPGGLNIAAVALMLLGTQWYVLFNVIAGAMAIPSDLREAAAIYRLGRWQRWRTLILPAIFPSLVTGMITATGGAWNASIVSEFVTFGSHTYSTIGLGSLIAEAAGQNNFALLLAATLAMAVVVVAVNRLLWRRLYRLAEQRFRLD